MANRATLILGFIVGLLLVAVAALVITRPSPSPKPVPLWLAPNADYLHALGHPVDVEQGCIFFGGNDAHIKSLIYAPKNTAPDHIRLTAVCVADVPPGPAN